MCAEKKKQKQRFRLQEDSRRIPPILAIVSVCVCVCVCGCGCLCASLFPHLHIEGVIHKGHSPRKAQRAPRLR